VADGGWIPGSEVGNRPIGQVSLGWDSLTRLAMIAIDSCRDQEVLSAMPSVEVLRTEQSWIRKTPDVCGGDACIRNTRITVWGLVEWRKLGLSDDEIHQCVRGLTPADLAIAWDYYTRYRDEIGLAIRENEEA